MPGPITIEPPTGPLAGPLALLRQHRNPVYDALGRKVGSFDTLDALCQGKWWKFEGVAQPPANALYVRDFWGRRVPLATRCVGAAKASAAGGIRAALAPPVQAGSAAKAAGAARASDPAPVTVSEPLELPTLDDFMSAGQGAAGGQALERYAILGGVALVALAVVMGGRK